jgi:hypothetical protein
LNKLTQQKGNYWEAYTRGRGPASLGIHYQERLQWRAFDLQQVLYSEFSKDYNDPPFPPLNYIDPPYIYTCSLHLIERKWLQQSETRSQIHGSTTNTNLIKETRSTTT